MKPRQTHTLTYTHTEMYPTGIQESSTEYKCSLLGKTDLVRVAVILKLHVAVESAGHLGPNITRLIFVNGSVCQKKHINQTLNF